MSTLIIRDQKVYYDGYDITGDLAGLDLSVEIDALEATTLGSSTRKNIAGLESISLSLDGYWNGGDGEIDDVLFGAVGSVKPVTVAAVDGSDGSLAYICRTMQAQYQPGASVGDIFSFSASSQGGGGDRIVRATILHPATARTASGNGTGRQLGAVSSSQKLYAVLHVLAVSGTTPTLDVEIESDTSSSFLAPTSRITFSQASAIGSEWASVDGAITDDWWRITYTIAGTSPSFTFVVAAGIR